MAGEIGLDEEEFEYKVSSGKYRVIQQKLLDHTYREAKIAAVPTFIIGETSIEEYADRTTFEHVIIEELAKQFDNQEN